MGSKVEFLSARNDATKIKQTRESGSAQSNEWETSGRGRSLGELWLILSGLHYYTSLHHIPNISQAKTLISSVQIYKFNRKDLKSKWYINMPTLHVFHCIACSLELYIHTINNYNDKLIFVFVFQIPVNLFS